jgi:steroid delta-isomerase-like uncharacterized protein
MFHNGSHRSHSRRVQTLTRVLPVATAALLLSHQVLFAPTALARGEALPGDTLAAQVSQEEAKRALVRRWLSELWDGGNYAAAEELLAPDFRRHSEGFPAVGPEAYAAIVKSCHDGFPDTRIVMVDEPIVEDDRVFVRWRWTGTHKAEFRGVPASGRKIDVLGEDVIRIRDGRITDIWPLFDPLRLMLQIGAIEQVVPQER